ncbi:MAG TPA: hydroxyacid dehydrogenase [Chloroflexota bacterium]|nr:hydroxyacid dehydrogenase [Chloroflexota bacterium]
MRVSIPDNFPVVYPDDAPALAPLRARGEVAIHSTRAATAAELIDRLTGAETAINVRAYSKFTEEVFDALPDLRFLTVMGTGTDNIDLIAATSRGVVVSNTPTAPTISVAEHALALLFAVTKNLIPMHNALMQGNWKHLPGIELRGKTFGMIGLGIIAAEVAPVVRALGMRVIGWSLTRDEARAERLGVELVDFEQVLSESDVVSLHLRASQRTAGLIGTRELGLMKPSAYLINTARGAIVDENALYETLANHRIAGAAVDVYQTEPLPATSPLLTLDNIVVTPHVAWVTDAGIDRMMRHPVENIIAYLEGRPQFVVNPPVVVT